MNMINIKQSNRYHGVNSVGASATGIHRLPSTKIIKK